MQKGSSTLKLTGGRIGEPGQANQFRMKAVDAGDALELHVLRDGATGIGRFVLREVNGDFELSGSAAAGPEVSVKNAARHFMAERSAGGFTLEIPAAGASFETPVLGDAGAAFRVVPAAQSTTPALDKPSFFETFDSTYFVRSRPAVDLITNTVSAPENVVPAPEVGHLSPKAGLDASPTHPWVAAQLAIGPAVSVRTTVQAGVSKPILLTATGIERDSFLLHGPKAAAQLRPSVRLTFQTAFHPHVAEFARRARTDGVDALLSLDSQSLGNPYLRASWYDGYVLSTTASDAACLIEGGVGRDPVSGRPGNFEAVVLEDHNLVHYWHDSSGVTKPWLAALTISNKAIGPGSLTERVSEQQRDVQGRVQVRGTFEVVALQADGLAHYSWPVSQPPQWTANGLVTPDAAGPGCVIETDFLTGGKRSLEVLVPETTAVQGIWRLVRYRLDNGDAKWKPIDVVADRVLGPACFIQSSVVQQGHGRFEALVLERNPFSAAEHRLVHYWKDETVAAWQRGIVLSEAATSAGSLIESRVQDTRANGNFEALVREGAQLVHYWRDNASPLRSWHRGQVITTRAAGAGCLMQSHFGAVGNFEILVPEQRVLKHYWHANDGPAGSPSERFYFMRAYTPTGAVEDPYPRRDVEFSYGEPYSDYNWELFFHLPMLMATRLMRSQRYPDARRWLHRVFDPTDGSNELTTERFWKFLPLRDNERLRFDQMLLALHSTSPDEAPLASDVRAQISEWLAHPFMPHRIARMRPAAYKKWVVMTYIENEIAWADQLFRMGDTIETINEATLHYVVAGAMLGPVVASVPARTKTVAKTYHDLRELGIDEFGDAVVELENEFPFASALTPVSGASEIAGLLGVADTLYFGIPKDEKLLSLRNTIDDRLYKIRHSLNIEGVFRELPLFEPPIDADAFLAAATRGISIGAAIAALNAPLPFYRFSYTHAKAVEAANDVKALGAAFLAAREKGDAEALARLRAEHERTLLTLVKTVKNQQVEEAQAAQRAILKSREVAVARWRHYQHLLGLTNPDPPLPAVQSSVTDGKYTLSYTIADAAKAEHQPSGRFELVDMGTIGIGASLTVGDQTLSVVGQEDDNPGTKILSYEKEELVNSFNATASAAASSAMEAVASLMGIIPTFGVNIEPLGCGATVSFGGQNLGSVAAAGARLSSVLSTIFSHNVSRAAKLGAIVLRERDWVLQNNLAARDIAQIDHQLVSAHVRIDITNEDAKNQLQQIADAQAVDQFYRDKFSNQERYDSMAAELSHLHSQAFDLASDLAMKAEQCYRFERGVTSSSFIRSGAYWDEANRGMLAGERLHLALRQMEHAYHDQNGREYELVKHVSLLSLDPLQLIRLKETGLCDFELPEALFDLDYPGHYMRRIKSVGLTIPCVVGPYVGVACTLRLTDSVIRFQQSPGAQYARTDDEDPRFFVNRAAADAIATSTGQNDAGTFDLNFHDERYLSFEGAGAVSRWRVELAGRYPQLGFDCPQFDYETITDVILHVRYTARDGGERLKAAAVTSLKAALKDEAGLPPLHGGKGAVPAPLSRLFSLRHEFPNEWQKLTRIPGVSEPGPVVRAVDIPVVKTRFPYFVGGMAIQPVRVTLIAVPRANKTLANLGISLKTSSDDPAPVVIPLQARPEFGRALVGGTPDGTPLAKIQTDSTKGWTVGLSLTRNAMVALSEDIQDLFVMVNYTAKM